jgi:PhnB protein
MPYLPVPDGHAALEFYARAFGAETVHIVPDEDGSGVLHARFFVNGAMIMLYDESPGINPANVAPRTAGTTTVTIRLRLADAVEALFESAVEAGAEAIQDPADMPWGERYAKIRDPAGHVWAMGGPSTD